MPCDDDVIVSAEAYITAHDDHLNINSIEIIDDCLVIDFGSSGCDGSTWELKLIDADVIMESDPPQRNVRLSLKNDELCDAYFSKVISFDISALQVDGNKLLINLKGHNEPILYKY